MRPFVFTVPRDCSVSRWNEWSQCDTPCGLGKQNRTRTVLIEAKFGGRVCPILSQKRRCFGDRCWEVQDVESQMQERQGEFFVS